MSSLRPCKQERRNTKAERCTDFFLFVLLEIWVPFHLVCSQCLRFLLFVLYINFRNLQKSRPSVSLLSISNNYSAHPHKCQLTHLFLMFYFTVIKLATEFFRLLFTKIFGASKIFFNFLHLQDINIECIRLVRTIADHVPECLSTSKLVTKSSML